MLSCRTLFIVSISVRKKIQYMIRYLENCSCTEGACIDAKILLTQF